jgi:hypothetical protein
MGNLKPGVTYIYEVVNGITYAREFGTNDRTVVSEQYVPSDHLSMTEVEFWRAVKVAGKDNPALQEAIDRVKVLYYLGLQNGT